MKPLGNQIDAHCLFAEHFEEKKLSTAAESHVIGHEFIDKGCEAACEELHACCAWMQSIWHQLWFNLHSNE